MTLCGLLLFAAAIWPSTFCWALVSSSILRNAVEKAKSVLDPRTGEPRSVSSSKTLVVLLPQLGEFDSAEFCEPLAAVFPELQQAQMDLCVIGIGSPAAAKRFCDFIKLPLDCLGVDPGATLHQELQLHAGPGWDVPETVSDGVLTFLLNTLPGGAPRDETLLRPTAKAWLNYLLMCAGIGAPGTLRRGFCCGYFGDPDTPERFRDTDNVKAGLVTIGPGVGPVEGVQAHCNTRSGGPTSAATRDLWSWPRCDSETWSKC